MTPVTVEFGRGWRGHYDIGTPDAHFTLWAHEHGVLIAGSVTPGTRVTIQAGDGPTWDPADCETTVELGPDYGNDRPTPSTDSLHLGPVTLHATSTPAGIHLTVTAPAGARLAYSENCGDEVWPLS